MNPGDDVKLRDYVERMLSDLRRDLDGRFEAINAKLVVMNEIRGQLNDQARTFATRDMTDANRARIETLASREMVEDIRARLEHTATRAELEATIVGRATRFAAAEDRLGKLEAFQSNLQGRMWAMGALIFFGALIINLVLRFLFQARGT